YMPGNALLTSQNRRSVFGQPCKRAKILRRPICARLHPRSADTSDASTGSALLGAVQLTNRVHFRVSVSYGGWLNMMVQALQKLIEELEEDTSLHEPNNLRQRIEALDRLDAFNPKVSPLVADSNGVATFHCAKALQAKLEAANCEVYDTIRRDIQQGHG